MDKERDGRKARIHGSTLSLEEYALKLNTFRLRYKLPDRTTCALLKMINEIFGQKDCETSNKKKRLPTTIKRLNKLSFSLCNKDCLLTYRTINTGHIYGYTSVFELMPQLRDIIQRKSINNQNTRKNEINIKISENKITILCFVRELRKYYATHRQNHAKPILGLHRRTL